ncbi:MAG: NAD/NADP octopine/nopaline dehydrogenase family protein [Thermoguttaceae bacterium]|nr:NAD/NADP octopine/nopaline dehydrogenase family protein [Thermoguttaceae bacterium]
MTPSNPILHTTRLRTIFNDWREGVVYDYLPLFYEEWNDASSELLIACDEEVQEICRALPEFDLRFVKSLRTHYESYTVDAMTKKISSITAFKGLPTPVVKVEGGFIPDLHSRYFTADFSYGLTIIKQVANFANVQTPHIDATLRWYEKIAVEKDEFRFEDYGITDRESFEKFYLK